MDTHIADAKLKELHVEETTVSANDRRAARYGIDAVAEKKLLRKVDLLVIPLLWFFFMLSFLDRTNIGNAKIQGLEDELGMSGNDYNIALFIFFPPYILFEVPSNVLIKRMRPSTWLSLIMVLWGIATVAQGLVTNRAGLIGCRFMLGMFEAGFFPGCTYLISMWYKRYELQWRFNLFFSGAILAGSFSGLLAFALAKMDGIGGYSGWRWIFIIEGLFTIVCAIGGKFLLPDWPETSKFLTEEERELLVARLAQDVGDAKMNRLDKPAMKRIFTDWKIYCGILMYFGIVNTGYSTSFFTPVIIQQLGFTASAAQVRTIPVFIVATFFSLLTAWLTDRLRHRYSFCIAGICTSTVGYVLLLNQASLSVGVQYFAIFVIVSGCYVCQPITLAWVNNNMGGHYKRSVSSAMMAGFGNCGGLVASNVFLSSEVPGYVTGYSVGLALIWVCAIACTALLWGVRRENRKRDRGERDHLLEHADEDNLGDDHPRFRFTY
ncbi:hypothetical protein MBLNU230_g3647t1 [Neophaeotheca triangularis]